MVGALKAPGSGESATARLYRLPAHPEGAPAGKALSGTPRRGLCMGPALEQIWPGASEYLVTLAEPVGRCPDVSDSADALKACQIQTDKGGQA